MNSSILSFPERGPWGDSSYHGNCSGHIIRTILDLYKPDLFIDPAQGSGTSGDVARAMNIRYLGFDLKEGFDLLNDSLLDATGEPAELAFFHPPYHDVVQYSGHVWGTERSPNDLSNCTTYREFIAKLKTACFNIWRAVAEGGRLAILIGDIRKRGMYLSPQAHIQHFGMKWLEGILIKEQHNTRSSSKQYSGRFIPIMHEYLLVFRKESSEYKTFQIRRKQCSRKAQT